jgi:hypothetical protein
MSSTAPDLAPSLPAPAGYHVRRFQPDDAAGIVECVRRIYGDSYVHPELYDAEAIRRLNAGGELVSVVALATGGQIVGHYGLERPNLGVIAETGEALVLPDHRHHQLMEWMRTLVEQSAGQLKLKGLFGNVVTNHVFSQRVVERFGERPCAIDLGWSPRTFHNTAAAMTQRLSEVVYFKYLDVPEQAVAYLPQRHRLMCLEIYEHLVATVELRPVPAEIERMHGCASIERRDDLQRAIVRVQSVGQDSASALSDALESFQHSGIEAVFLDLPLADPAAPILCEQAESLGFFFAGVCPHFAPSGDVLRLQWLNVELDESQIQLESPFARKLLDYVSAERRRVSRR